MARGRRQRLIRLQFGPRTPVDEVADQVIAAVFQFLGLRMRDWQAQAIASLLKGHDLLVKAGTGAGKTLVAQAMMFAKEEGVVLVVAPLKSIIIDQVTRRAAIADTSDREIKEEGTGRCRVDERDPEK